VRSPRLDAEFADSSAARAGELFAQYKQDNYRRTDRLFVGLLAIQWIAGIVVALWVSPLAWDGASSRMHLRAAVVLGGIISLSAAFLARFRPGLPSTRFTIATAQVLMGGLLIQLTGGRIETHFHVFGSLALLSLYRDWRVLVQATVVAALDHLLRGIMWPQSVYGVLAASQWRWLEHTAWAIVADMFLVVSCVRSVAEMRQRADRTAALEQEVRVRHVAEKDARNREWQNDAVLDAAQAALAERVSLASLTAAVGLALTHGPDTRAMLQRCAAALVHHFDDGFAAIWTLDEHDQMLDLQATAGVETPVDAAYSRVPAGRFAIGAIARERKPHITVGFSVDAQIGGAEWALRKGLAAFAGYPLLLDSKAIGVMAIFARRDFSPSAVDAMAAVADSMALGIGRKRSEPEVSRRQLPTPQLPTPNGKLSEETRVGGWELEVGS
jgi:hypothetical protein